MEINQDLFLHFYFINCPYELAKVFDTDQPVNVWAELVVDR